MAIIMELYPQHNKRHLPVPNPKKAHAAMRRFLLDNPDYPEDALQDAIHHKFMSEGRVQAPDRWIPQLAEYIDSPLDKFNQPMWTHPQNEAGHRSVETSLPDPQIQ